MWIGKNTFYLNMGMFTDGRIEIFWFTNIVSYILTDGCQ